MKKRTKWVLAAGALGLGALLLLGLDVRLTVRYYRVESGKVSAPVRLAVLTDLHSCAYGEGQRDLLEAVEEQDPDLVLLGGDIVDDDLAMDPERAMTAAAALAARWPTCYVTGNHEFWSGRAAEIKAELAGLGVTVLEGAWVTVDVRGQNIRICGIDDPAVGEETWGEQLEQVSAAVDGTVFSVLLTHRPERVEDYAGRGFDLVLAGHAHGGQWRLPGLINGLIAPNQGLFPQYAGGRYDLGDTALIVSRSLARESTRVPRIFNPPELVVVDVEPAKK